MKQKLISLMTAVTMLASLFGAMPLAASAAETQASSIKLGDYVTMGGIKWRCVAFEKVTGNDASGNPIIDSTQTSQTYKDGYLPLMLADASVGRKAFDTIGPISASFSSHSRDSDRSYQGSNYWGDSNIRAWLNSSAEAGKVYYPCGNPPLDEDRAGFLTKFNSNEQSMIKTVTQKSLLASCDKDIAGALGSAAHTYNTNIAEVVQNYSSAYFEQLTDTMFLLDVRQVYNVYANGSTLGNDYYKLSEYSQEYWLRSPSSDSGTSVRFIDASGSVTYEGTASLGGTVWNTTTNSVRPAFFLNPSALLDGSGTEDAPYTAAHIHNLKHFDKIDVTCTSSGRTEFWQCTGEGGCYKIFSDANGINETTYANTVIYSKGHTWGEWEITKEATETEKGEKRRECTVCHTTETKEIAGLNELNRGDYLEMGEYNGSKILWRCVAFEKATRQADGSVVINSAQTNTKYQAVGENEGDTGFLPLMLADVSIGNKEFDAKGSDASGSHGRGKGRTDRGSNYWGDSNIRAWLNSADKTVSYSCGNAPDYKDEAGFLNKFNSAEKAAIQTVTQKAIINKCDWDVLDASKRSGYEAHTYTTTPVADIVQNYSSAYSEQITDKMFLLDVQQLYNASVALGSYYKPSADAEYLLRTPYCDTDHSVRYVSSSGGSLDVYSASNNTYGVRPAFFLDLSSVEFDGGDGAKETPHTIPKPPHYHTLMHYEAAAPTCTASGNSEYWKCEGDEGCNKMFSDEDCTTEITEIPTINAAGHKLTKTEARDATCTQEGNREYWTCSVCDKMFSDANGTTEISEIPTIPTIAHTEETIPAVAATCTEKGKTAGVKCSVCGTVLTAPTETAALGHSWGEWEITKPATENEKGTKTRECSRCNETETQDIPVLGHTHTMTAHAAKAATCTESGNIAYWECSGCNKLFSDANGTTEITKADTIIAAKGHTEVEIPAVAATCTKGGKTAGVKCSVCGTVLTAPTGTAALGHSWGDWEIIKEATETEDGEKSRECSRCNETETQVIPATGHTCDWGDWTITTTPTLTATGKAERVCKTNAAHKESADLPVLTDTTVWTYEETKAPTQDTDGEGKYMSVYGEVKITLPATGADKFSIRYEGGNAIVNAPTAGTYTVLFAAYDGSGRLTSLSAQTVTVEKGETTVEPINFTAGGTVKVMLWESMLSMKPLCAAGK